MKKIFVSHPFSNDPKGNFEKVERICKRLKTLGHLPLSPLHLFSFFEEDKSEFREAIMEACFRLIDQADVVYVYGDSKGCRREKRYALANGIPVVDCKTEIERKFLVDSFDDVPFNVGECDFRNIRQFYTIVEDDYEERYRMETFPSDVGFETQCLKVIKEGQGLARKEKIEQIDYYTYTQKMFEEKILTLDKIRYDFDLDGYEACLDFYRAPEVNLIVLEVEFPSVEEAKEFIPPDWVKEEVTEDESYKNKNIWKKIQG